MMRSMRLGLGTGVIGDRLRRAIVPLAAFLCLPTWASAPPATVAEAEPNDTPAAANVVAVGDTVTGTIDPGLDYDYFALDLQAGTGVDVRMNTGADGLQVAIHDGAGVLAADYGYGCPCESRLVFRAPSDGRYYVAVFAHELAGGPGLTYSIRLDTLGFSETEPNDTPAQAEPYTLGDTTRLAVIQTDGDWDLYRVALDSGTIVHLDVRDEEIASSPLRWSVRLLGADGADTLLSGFEYFGPYRHLATRTGDYIVAVGATFGAGAASAYSLRVSAVTAGPGDPVRVIAADLGYLMDIATAPDGDVFVLQSGRVLKMTPEGDFVVWADPGYVNAIAVDAFGALLARAYVQDGTGAYHYALFQYTAPGDSTLLAPNLESSLGSDAIAIAPNGDILVATYDQVLRFDPFGAPLDSIEVDYRYNVDRVLFAVDGRLQFTQTGYPPALYDLGDDGSADYRMTLPGDGDVAYDEDGYLYYGDANGVRLWTPDYQPVPDPVMIGAQVTNIAFGRTPTGAAARLFATSEMHGGSVVEVDPAGLRAPGHLVGVVTVEILEDSLPAAVMGFDYTVQLTHSGSATLTWTVGSGALPAGLALDASGVIAGVPEETGSYTVGVLARADGAFGFKTLALAVSEPSVSLREIERAVLRGGTGLSDGERTFVDLRGNANGRLDVGDLRAFYRSRGLIRASRTDPRGSGSEE